MSFTVGHPPLAVLHRLSQRASWRPPRHSRLAALGAAAVLYLLTVETSTPEAQLSYEPSNTVMALACALLLASVVFSTKETSRVVRALEVRPLVALGLISYSIFLWHHPLVLVLREHGLTVDGHLGLVLDLVLVLLLSIALAALTYLLVERPALRLKDLGLITRGGRRHVDGIATTESASDTGN